MVMRFRRLLILSINRGWGGSVDSQMERGMQRYIFPPLCLVVMRSCDMGASEEHGDVDKWCTYLQIDGRVGIRLSLLERKSLWMVFAMVRMRIFVLW